MRSIYTIYNASAGAGKTYTLVKNFLSILLKNKQPESIRSILAVTFTNKAANEMKARILKWLKDFTEEATYLSNSILQQIAYETGINIEILHQRSKKSLSYLLHHYSLLSISTIDKFNLRLMRAFTKELGLSYSFAVELDTTEYLKQSIDELIDELGTDNPFAEVILNYIFWKFDSESSTDIRKELLISSQNFLKEMHLEKIHSLSSKDFEDFKKLNVLLLKRTSSNHKKIKEIAKCAINLIENLGLQANDFYQGGRGIGGFFYKLTDETLIKQNYAAINLKSNFYKDFCENEKYAKLKSTKINEIESIAPQLIKYFYQTKELINRIKIDESVRQNLITIELQSEISRFLNQKKSENDILFLSDVNPIINNHLKNEPVAFIYEKLGGKYNHYFIDEFQDTSQLQWNNFLPLVENAKVTYGSSITLVGDPKQSIYRFRSGKPEILMNLISNSEKENISIITLPNNYRSLPNIVNFNNDFYQFIAETELTNEENKKLFGSHSYQIPYLKNGGRVQISFVSPDIEENSPLVNRILEIIEESISNRFYFKDIAILTRNKKHSFPIIEALTEKGYPVLTEEALLLSSSPVILTIISALKWLNTPQNKEALIYTLYQLHILRKIELVDFTSEMLKIKDLSFTDTLLYLKNTFEINICDTLNNNLSFYDFVENLIRSLKFGKGDEMYLSALLDVILHLEKNGTISINDFLENWELKSSNLSVQFPENMNAIQVMTIHKSKGLEFPIVIYPLAENRVYQDEYWFPLEEDLYNGFNQYYTYGKSGVDQTNDAIDEVIEIKKSENFIDDLCVQYVATTRASQQLFILKEQKNSDIGRIEKFLKKNHFPTEGIIELYPDIETQKINLDNKNSLEEKNIDWISESWSQKIKVSTEIGKKYTKENKEIRYGNIIHQILSEITTENKVYPIIQKLIFEGIIDREEEKIITQTINSVIKHKQLKNYFSGQYFIYPEREILFEGRFYRPDRLVEINGIISILDFKTGKKLPKHKKQIKEYAKVLESLGKKIKDKILVYIFDKIEIVKVDANQDTTENLQIDLFT